MEAALNLRFPWQGCQFGRVGLGSQTVVRNVKCREGRGLEELVGAEGLNL